MTHREYNADKVAQHTQLILDLQKANAHASHLMLRLGRMRLQQNRLKALCEELTSLGRSMTSQMFLCEQIAGSSVDKHYDVIEVIIGSVCDHCLASANTRKAHSEVLIPSQAWAIQVERLPGLLMSVAHNVSQTSLLPRRIVEQSLRSLADLSKILSRQRRHLEHISGRQPPEINVMEDHSAVCPECGRPYTVTATDE